MCHSPLSRPMGFSKSPRPFAVLVLAVCALSVLNAGPQNAHAATSAKEILDSIDDMHRAQSAHGVMTMKVQTENWARELTIEFWSKGKDKSMMRIKAPKKEKGTSTLRAEGNIWNYLPKVKKVIKVPGSMMGGSWMGSHFTNDDLVKQSRMADDYDFKITFDSSKDGLRDGEDQVEITCIPKEDAAVVWGKIVVTVRKHEGVYVAKNIQYYDEDMKLARTMDFSEYKKLSGEWIAMRAKMVPQDKVDASGTPKEYTEMIYQSLEFGVGIEDSLFTLRSLQR